MPECGGRSWDLVVLEYYRTEYFAGFRSEMPQNTRCDNPQATPGLSHRVFRGISCRDADACPRRVFLACERGDGRDAPPGHQARYRRRRAAHHLDAVTALECDVQTCAAARLAGFLSLSGQGLSGD